MYPGIPAESIFGAWELLAVVFATAMAVMQWLFLARG